MRTTIALVTLLTGSLAWSATTETLPAGVRALTVRGGMITGLDDFYKDNGHITKIGDTKSISFDAATLAKVNDKAKDLIDVLNSIGSQSLGSQINLGTLKIDTKPEINYYAPVFAYGFTKRLTMAIAAPVVHYKNKVTLTSENSNAESFIQMGLSRVSQELSAALKLNMVTETEKLLAQKGYKPLSSRDQTYLDDVKLAGLYQISKSRSFEILYQGTLGLPTGPKFDPDDLLAPNQSGRTSLENSIAFGWKVHRKLKITPNASVLVYMPDHVEQRVPATEGDLMPGPDQKVEVSRQLGLTSKVGTDLDWQMTSYWSSMLGADYSMKTADQYNGGRSGLRYDLLSKDTDQQWATLSAGVSFSTVNAYFRKRFAVPLITSLSYSDIFSGRNTQRQTRTELTLMMFF